MKNNNRYLLVLYQMQVMLRRLAQRYDRETHISWRYTYVQYSECLHTDGSIYYYSKVVHILVPLLLQMDILYQDVILSSHFLAFKCYVK